MGTIEWIIAFVVGCTVWLVSKNLYAGLIVLAVLVVLFIVGSRMLDWRDNKRAAEQGSAAKKDDAANAEGQLYEYDGYIGRTPMEAIIASEDDHDICMYCGCYTGGTSDVCPDCLGEIQNGGL